MVAKRSFENKILFISYNLNKNYMSVLSEKLTENGTVKVLVTYPDGKNTHTTTVRDLGDRFIKEGTEWKVRFFNKLIDEGKAYSKFGEYTLQK